LQRTADGALVVVVVVDGAVVVVADDGLGVVVPELPQPCKVEHVSKAKATRKTSGKDMLLPVTGKLKKVP